MDRLNRVERVEYIRSLKRNRGLTRALAILENTEIEDIYPNNETTREILQTAWQTRHLAKNLVVMGYNTLSITLFLRILFRNLVDIHVCDNFDGSLPSFVAEDYDMNVDPRAGEEPIIDRPDLSEVKVAVSGVSELPTIGMTEYSNCFTDRNLKPPIMTRDFNRSFALFVKNIYPINFALIDAKLYLPTLNAIRFVRQRIVHNGIMIIRNEDESAGVSRAFTKFDEEDPDSMHFELLDTDNPELIILRRFQ